MAKNRQINVRVSEQEYAIIESRAAALGLDVSAYVRRAATSDNTEMREQIAELRDILERSRDHAIIARLPQPDSVPDDWEGQPDYRYPGQK